MLRARASELESEFAFGIALQLFEPLLAGADDETHDRLLAGSAALAGPLLERPTSWGGNEAEERSYSVMHGLFWLLANLAETGPVLIVDRRRALGRPRVAAARAVPAAAPGRDGGLVHRHPPARRARRARRPARPDRHPCREPPVRPAPLSRDGAPADGRAALPDADEAFADACWRMTEGNVFLLGELIAAVADEGWQPTAQNAARIGTLAPEAVLRAVAVRLMRLSDDAAGVARAVAVLGDDAQLRHVVALTGREPERVAAAADALAASDILRPLDPAR